MAREASLMLAALLIGCGGGDAAGPDANAAAATVEDAAPAAATPTDSAAAQGPAPIAFDTAAARGERPLMRETYSWDPAPRDPFRALFVMEGGGPELPDLVLTSVIQQPSDPSKSIAIFQDRGSSRRYTVSPGQHIGRLTVVEINPETVTLRMNDYGTIRDQTYNLRRSEDGTP